MFFNSDIKKNILYITEEEEQLWYTGEVIDRTADNLPNDVYVLAQEQTKQIIGSTIMKNGFLLNFVPKWRRPNREDAKDEIINEKIYCDGWSLMAGHIDKRFSNGII